MAGIREATSTFGLWKESSTNRSQNRSPSNGWRKVGELKPEEPPDLEQSLAKTIESELIPRLLLVHSANLDAADGTVLHPDPDDVEEFARLVLSHDIDVAATYIEVLRGKGISLEVLFLDLLAPTAQYFGEMWQDDSADFMTVTLGMSRLQQVLRRFSPAFEDEDVTPNDNGRVLLAAAPGEQHSFGIFMVEEFFRRAGWQVCHASSFGKNDALRLVSEESFAVIGLSLSSETFIVELASYIRAIRRRSRNRSIVIMVGGKLFIEHPELVAVVGADATAVDGKRAVQEARDILGASAACG